MKPLLQIAVTNTGLHLQQAAQGLARQLLLPYFEIVERNNIEFILVLTEQGLLLQHNEKKGLGHLRIDFLTGEIAYRLAHLREQKQLLVKAIGPKIYTRTCVLDLTAGLGHDGFILAKLAYSMTLLERSAIIAALLQDGLQRAACHEKHTDLDIQLIRTDAMSYLDQITRTEKFPDIIYLDPMYPRSNKSALVKKEMRFLRKIVGDDTDAEQLLPLAIRYAKQRVVVKRPRLADYLATLKPQHSIRGKQHRFDVYLKQTLS